MEQKTNCSTLIESSKNRGHFVLFGRGEPKGGRVNIASGNTERGEQERQKSSFRKSSEFPDDTFKTENLSYELRFRSLDSN